MILAFGEARCDCKRHIELAMVAEDAPATAEAIAAAYAMAAFMARLLAVARGWAVGEQLVVCVLCLERPDVGTVHQDAGP